MLPYPDRICLEHHIYGILKIRHVAQAYKQSLTASNFSLACSARDFILYTVLLLASHVPIEGSTISLL